MKSLKLSTAAALAFGGALATACANEDQSAYSDETAATEVASNEPAAAEPMTTPDAAAASPTTVEANLAGQAVFDETGVQVGTVDKVVTDAAGVEVAVVSVGAALGIGTKSISIPTAELTAKTDGAGLTVAMTADEIEAAPAYVESPSYTPPADETEPQQ